MLIDVLTPQVGLIFFQTVVMLCVAFILKTFAWQSILGFVKKEEEDYEKTRRALHKARIKTDALRKMSTQIITKAETRSQRIIETALATKQALIAEAKMAAMAEKEQTMALAQRRITQQATEARLKIKQETANLVLLATQKLLAIELDKKPIQEALLRKLIEEATQQQQTHLV